MNKATVVVGGGISGMLAAWLLARRGARVLLVEREAELGGLLRAFDYGEAGLFDYGMHNMYETGIAELDALMFSLLPQDEWQLLEGGRRDLAGLYYNGRLQRHSLFMDLRTLPAADYEACVGGLFSALEAPAAPAVSAADVAYARFGEPAVRLAVAPALRKLYGLDAAELDPMALALTSLSRLVLFGEPAFLDLMKSDLVRERIGFPEQRNLPLAFSAGRKGYYPRQYGMWRVIAAFRHRLEEAGVEVRTSTQLASIRSESGRVVSVSLQGETGAQETEVDALYWSTGLPGLAMALGVPLAGLPFDPPPKTVVVNLLLERAPAAMGDLYYSYCYDPGFETFRVTNYPAYCDGAVRAAGYPLCVELLKRGPGVPDREQLERQAIDELLRMGILASAAEVHFARAEPLAAGFPMPSLRNTRGLAQVRGRIEAAGLDNVTALGILSEPGVFFQRDVLRRTWERLEGEPR